MLAASFCDRKLFGTIAKESRCALVSQSVAIAVHARSHLSLFSLTEGSMKAIRGQGSHHLGHSSIWPLGAYGVSDRAKISI